MINMINMVINTNIDINNHIKNQKKMKFKHFNKYLLPKKFISAKSIDKNMLLFKDSLQKYNSTFNQFGTNIHYQIKNSFSTRSIISTNLYPKIKHIGDYQLAKCFFHQNDYDAVQNTNLIIKRSYCGNYCDIKKNWNNKKDIETNKEDKETNKEDKETDSGDMRAITAGILLAFVMVAFCFCVNPIEFMICCYFYFIVYLFFSL